MCLVDESQYWGIGESQYWGIGGTIIVNLNSVKANGVLSLLPLLGYSSDPSMCGCVKQQWLVLSCPGCDGAGPDDDPGHVEQRLLPQAAASLHL